MQSGYRFRLYLFTALILFGGGVLLTRLHSYQIVRTEEFRDMLPGTSTESIREPGVRGEIQDRNGIVLAENLISREITFNLREIKNAYYRNKRSETLPPGTLERMEEILQRKKREAPSISDIVNAYITPKLEELGLAVEFSENALDVHFSTYSGNVPFTYRKDVPYKDFARFAENMSSFPGIYVSSRPRRHYPYGALASHILGQVRQWDRGSIPEEGKQYDFYVGDSRGVAGVEQTMNEMLTGPEGARTIRKNEKGEYLGLQDAILPGSGATVTLTLDSRIQTLTQKALRRVGRAAAVVMDVNTGEIVAMASVPDFDPNDFIPPTDPTRLTSYGQNLASPFTNRAISQHAPGSTFKINTAIAGFRAGLGAPTHVCNGFVHVAGEYRPECWIRRMYGGSHGALNLSEAIQQSCNPYFFEEALDIGGTKMVETLELLQFGKKTGIRLVGEQAGIIPGTTYWHRMVKQPGEVFGKAMLAQLSIGQGSTEATPLQLAAMLSAVANGGRYYQPRIIKKVEHPDTGVMIEDTPILKVDLTEHGVQNSQLDEIRKGMWMAANVPKGTARRAAPEGIDIGAKTGTAQTSRFKSKYNAWTVAFAPYDAPRYAVVCIVESGQSGGAVAGPIVQLIMKGLFSQERGINLPVERMQAYEGNLDTFEELILPDDDPLLLSMDDVGETSATFEEPPPELVPDNQTPFQELPSESPNTQPTPNLQSPLAEPVEE